MVLVMLSGEDWRGIHQVKRSVGVATHLDVELCWLPAACPKHKPRGGALGASEGGVPAAWVSERVD